MWHPILDGVNPDGLGTPGPPGEVDRQPSKRRRRREVTESEGRTEANATSMRVDRCAAMYYR